MGIWAGIGIFLLVIVLIAGLMGKKGILGSIANAIWYLWRKFWVGILILLAIGIAINFFG